MEKIIKLKEQLKEEEKAFDEAKDLQCKKNHINKINKLIIRIGQIEASNNIQLDEDLIKAPFEYISSEEESLFYK